MKSLVMVAVVVLSVLFLMTSTAVAEVDTTSSTDYSGGEENATQVIVVEYTLTPEGSEITDARIEVEQTSNAFIDTNTFDLSVNPAGVESEVETISDGTIEVNELGVGEEVTISYEVYPREIKTESLEVSTVEASYVQNGQELSDTHRVEADLSDSPWFLLEEARQTISSLRQTISSLQNYFWIGVGGVIFGLIGIALAAFYYREYQNEKENGGDKTPG